MPKSKIIIDIVENKIKLSDALYRVILIATELENTELLEWAKLEVNGYNQMKEVPEYRIKSSSTFHYTGLNGPLQINGATLDVNFLSQETLKEVSKLVFLEDINSIEEKVKSKEDVYNRDVSFLAGEVYKNSSDGFNGIQCTSIRQVVGKQFFASIYNAVKTKLIEILTVIEKEVGSLDKKDISRKIRTNKNKVNVEIAELIKTAEISFETTKSKFLWKIIVPIVTGILGGLAVLLIYELL